MSDRLMLRRYLYEEMGRASVLSRRRRSLRRQIAVLGGSGDGGGDGTGGVREPRRPSPGGDSDAAGRRN